MEGASCFIASGVVHHNSGKSELVAQLSVAWALGRRDPDVVRWALRNKLDVSCLPDRPGVVCSVALDSQDSRRYVRPKFGRYLPPGTRWRNRDGTGEAEAVTPSGGVVVFKSADQGADGFQGFDGDLIAFDEEPHDLGVVREARMRVVDRRGRLLFGMTPLMGWTPLLEELVREPVASTVIRWLHGTDNPHVPEDYLREMLATFGPHERAARERGEIVALEGRVYTDWRRDLHVVPAFDPPAEWPRYVGWDFGTRNPTAIVLAALDPADDVLHVYDVRYERERTLTDHASWLLNHRDWRRVEWVVADAADRASRLALAREHGISTRPSRKGVRAMISAVADRLRPDANGRPHLVVHDRCAPVIAEVESYVWDQRASRNDMADAPQKRGDHAMDALGYLCVELQAASDVGVAF